MNTRAITRPDTFGHGGGWSHSYQWELEINHPAAPTPTPPNWTDERPDGVLKYPDGRSVDLVDPWSDLEAIPAAEEGPYEMMDRFIDRHGGDYDLLLTDGGVVKFHKLVQDPQHPHCEARAIVDPHGLVTTLHYDSHGRLDKITEPGQSNPRYLEIHYGLHPWTLPTGYIAQIGLIDRVEANDGFGNVTQSVNYVYTQDSFDGKYFLYLTGANYSGGDRAIYDYQASNRLPLNQYDPEQTFAGIIKTCDDDRFAGPMKRIKYELRPRGSYYGAAYGEIWKEENFVSGLALSELIIPTSPPPYTYPAQWRKEHRPDGTERTFVYRDGVVLSDRSDFRDQWARFSITFNSTSSNVCHFQDERGYTTDKLREGDFQATTRVTYPPIAPDTVGSFVETLYEDPAHHYIKSQQDERGNITTYFRNPDHSIGSILYPNGNGTGPDYPEFPDSPSEPRDSFTYSDNGFLQIRTHTIPNGGVTHWEYDGRGLKETSWPAATSSDFNPDAHPTRYFYYTAGNCGGRFYLIDRLHYVEDPLHHQTYYDYNERGQVTLLTHHEDQSFVQSHYNHDGTLEWVEDELTHRTTYGYDEYKRVTHVMKMVDNVLEDTVTNYARPGMDPLSHTTSSIYRVTSPESKIVDYDYDENFRRVMMRQAPGTLDEATTRYYYDWAGNLNRIEDPRHYFTSFWSDERNRRTTVTNETLSETITVRYDPAGNKSEEKRADGTLRSWDYDSMNRLHHAYEWRTSENPTPEQTTTYARDSGGVVRYISDTKGAIYRYDYDLQNRKITTTYPPDVVNVHRYESWHYDFAGNIDLYTNPTGQVKHLEYDPRNRVWHSWWTGVSGIPGPEITTVYDDASRIKRVSTNSFETIVDFDYNEANRQKWEEQTLALPGATPVTHRVNTTLDHDGLRKTLELTDPPALGGNLSVSPEMSGSGSLSVTYEYTERNQLKNINGGRPGENWSFSYKYDPSGNLSWRRADFNGHTNWTKCKGPESDAYDALNRPQMWEQSGLNGLYTLSHYQYDQANREQSTWREEDQKGERYAYEPTNQLAGVAYNASDVSTWPPSDAERTVIYGYTSDKLNRSFVTETLAGQTPSTQSYIPDPLNQYTVVGGSSYAYDTNFNLTNAGVFSGVYNAANQLVSASGGGSFTAGFVYDGLGRCVKRTLGKEATVFVYDGWKPIGEFDPWNDFLAWNLYGPGPDEILLRDKGNIGYTIFIVDRHGNVASLVDNDGVVLEQYKYDVFGQPTIINAHTGDTISSPWYSHDFLFQGREYISQLGIYDYRNRFYLPATGRFLQTDSKGFDAGDMNLFRYCGDDSVDGADPTGLSDRNYVPEWDIDIKGSVDGVREWYWRRMYGETKDKLILISAHGFFGGGGAFNSTATRQAMAAQKLNKPFEPSMRLDAQALAASIRALDNYTATKRVRLDICYAGLAGKDGALAQQVANILKGNTVEANTDVVRPDNGMGGGEWRDFNSPQSKLPTNVPNRDLNATRRYPGRGGPALGDTGRPAYGQLSSLVSTGGGGWATEGYFPGGGEEGEGFHPVPNKP